MNKYKDYLGNKSLSEELVRSIEEYWHRLGFWGVRAWVERVPSGQRRPIYVVRSNLTR